MQIELTNDEIVRYSRHILLPEVGGVGQMRLKTARVVIVGAGGLGSPLLLYLAAAGVGTIALVDDDRLEMSNLQRQIAHVTANIGMLKVNSAAALARALNPNTSITTSDERLDAGNVDRLIGGYDLVCDGSDNFATRFVVADGCVRLRQTLVSASVLRFEAQLAVFKPHAAPDLPCYRCLYPAPPPAELATSCADAGVLGAVTGVAGTLQATAALIELLGIGESLAGRLLLWDALSMRFRTISVPRDPACPVCGARSATDGG